MSNNMQIQPSFTSTFIPTKNNTRKVTEYLEPLNNYFECKGFSFKTTKDAIDKINLGQAAIDIKNGGMVVVGKDKSADTFINRVLKKVDPNVKFTDDVPEVKIEGEAIDLTI